MSNILPERTSPEATTNKQANSGFKDKDSHYNTRKKVQS